MTAAAPASGPTAQQLEQAHDESLIDWFLSLEPAARLAELESRLLGASPAQAADLHARIDKYAAKIARYDDEPDPAAPDDPLKGEGKKQLMAQAKAFEAMRDRASEQDNNFDYAEVVLQLALVLGSVAILAANRIVLRVAAVLGAIGTALTINGFLLLAPLPF